MLPEMLHFQLWSHEQYQGLLWIPPSTFVIAKILSQSQDNYCLAVWKSQVCLARICKLWNRCNPTQGMNLPKADLVIIHLSCACRGEKCFEALNLV
jgi:hypothetical protein